MPLLHAFSGAFTRTLASAPGNGRLARALARRAGLLFRGYVDGRLETPPRRGQAAQLAWRSESEGALISRRTRSLRGTVQAVGRSGFRDRPESEGCPPDRCARIAAGARCGHVARPGRRSLCGQAARQLAGQARASSRRRSDVIRPQRRPPTVRSCESQQ